MKNTFFKKLLPHAIAIVVFLVVSMLFCKPVLEGEVLNQTDIVGWKGAAQNAFEYKEKNGHLPLWNPNVFGGTPNYLVVMEGKSILPDTTKIFSLGLPKPINYFFLACICFYILCLALRIRPVIGILGGLAFAFSTYNPIIIGVGHESKMLAIAFAPLLLAGLIFTYNKKYWLGLSFVTIGAFQEIASNHAQVNYYLFLIAVAVTLSYLFIWIREKQWKHIGLSLGVIVLAAGAGLAANALPLMVSYEYTQYTMRGGKNVSIDGEKNVTSAKTNGLDTAYAFQYSVGKAETATLLMPEAFGGSSGKTLSENSNVIKKLTAHGVSEGEAIQLATSQLPKYWGGILSTAGPAYLGAIICILALIGFVLLTTPLRWGLLAVSLLAILMSWGKYLPGFNTFLFNHMPLYNKFRAPSMSLVITEIAIPIVAVLALQQLLFTEKSQETLKANFKKILYTVGGLFVFLGLMYFMMDYSSPIDQQVLAQKWDNSGNDEIGRLIVSGMKADRADMFGGQLVRALGFALVVVGMLYLYLKNIIKKPVVIAIVLVVVSSLDLLLVDKGYLNDDNYTTPDELNTQNFIANSIDQEILQDKDPDYRVFNLAADTYNDGRTSYFHKSVGGYHPAKLRIYQDIIEKYLSGRPDTGILNMLNTKYVIVQNPQTRAPSLLHNPGAQGPCWLVKYVKIVDNPVQSLLDIGATNLKDTAIVEKSFANDVTQPKWDSSATIKLTKFDPDNIEYASNATAPQFAVFSEVYYPKGWNAYIDGKQVNYCNANYVLRGLSIPAGKHEVKFVFEPATFRSGVSIQYIATYFIALFFLGGLFMAWRERRKRPAERA